MKKTAVFFVMMQLLVSMVRAQWQEDFSDGNFTTNPAWTGNAADWTINASGRLQSNSQSTNSSFYLGTPSSLASTGEWEFLIRLNFNTSSANYADVFVISSIADLTAPATTGYFIRIGNTLDEVALYRKDAAGSTKIIDGADGTTGSADNLLRIKLVRDATNKFTLYRDPTGTGNSYVVEGSVTDNSYTSSAWFGFLVKQSTSAFFGRHEFDEISVHPYIPDLSPPVLIKAVPSSPTGLDIFFSEPLDPVTAQELSNYTVDGGIGHPWSLQFDPSDHTLVHAVFGQNFSSGVTYAINVQGLRDLSGNTIIPSQTLFSFYRPQPYDVIIDEIMADPSPPVGLPNTEWIELKNRSGHPLDLTGWRIATETASSAPFPSCRLQPDSFLVLTGTSQLAAWTGYRNILPVPNFPSLDNEGAVLQLLSADGSTIHALAYASVWYNDPVKRPGGWSLEMIDTNNPCSGGNNWAASTDTRGGTPGQKNSIDALHPDTTPPQLLRSYMADSLTILVLFNKPLDSITATLAGHYHVDNAGIIAAHPLPPLFNTVSLSLNIPLQQSKTYVLSVDGLSDCRGNIRPQAKIRTGLSETATPHDLVVNELLFDPPPGVNDFVELYNRSHKIIDAQSLYLANRNSTGQLNSLQKLTDSPFLIFPADYLLLTANVSSLQQHYLVSGPLLQPSSLPSLPADAGAVVLVNSQGIIIDELSYSAKWHFPLITNPQGVSLERIDPAAPSQDQGNWHSAASTAGYATPGYKNSQYRQSEDVHARLELSPEVFSPDNDGRDDLLTISYSVEAIGYVANITIFDIAGRSLRRLVKNDLLGIKGKWTWDGLDESQRRLPPGPYIIYTELFNLQGRRKAFKNVVFIAEAPG
jgi:hypothetical protein